MTGLLIAAAVFSSISSPVLADETEGRAPQETTAESEVYLDKYLTPNGKTANGNPEYSVTLEQYVTGGQPEQAAKYPTDIVLVLDYSSSMSGAMTDGRHRWYGVAEGARSFLDSIAAENETREDDLKMRVAVVGYNNSVWTDSSFVTVTQETKEGLKSKLIPNEDSNTSGVAERLKDNTRTDLALNQADSLLSSVPSERKKAVVIITDGEPYDGTPGASVTMMSEAPTKAALVTARSMKDKGVLIFPVFVGISKNLQHVMRTTKSLGDLDKTDLGAIFMSLMSSDNPYNGSMEMDGTYTANTVTSVYPDGYAGECLKVTDSAAEIARDLTRISYYIVYPDSGKYGPNTYVKDTITWPFERDFDEPLKVYTRDRIRNDDGSFSWGEKVRREDLEAIAEDGQRIIVTGFDYSANAVTEQPKAGTVNDYGRELLVEFDIKAKKSFGGNHIATNEEDSGLYPSVAGLKDKSGDGPLGLYPVPQVNLKVNYGVIGFDRMVYVPENIRFEDLVTDYDNETIFEEDHTPDGKNNAFVDIAYTLTDQDGNTVGTLNIPAGTAYNWEEKNLQWDFPTENVNKSGTYTVSAVVTPVVAAEKEGDEQPLTVRALPKAHIFKPVITFKDTVQMTGDILDHLPGSRAVPKNDPHVKEYYWFCEDGKEPDPANEPQLCMRTEIMSGTQEKNGYPVITAGNGEDVPVKAQLYRLVGGINVDIADRDAVYRHVCGIYEEAACGISSHTGAKFVIHIRDIPVPEPVKKTDHPVIEAGDEIRYSIDLENGYEEEITSDLIDIFPYNGDGRGSSFKGKLVLSRVELDLSGSETTYNRYADGSLGLLVSEDGEIRTDEEETIRSHSGFKAVRGNATQSGKKVIYEGFSGEELAMKLESDLLPGEKIHAEVSFYVETEGTEFPGAGDLYANSAIAMNDRRVRETRPVTVKVAERSISGLVFFDENGNGLRDLSDQPVSNVKTLLYRAAKAHENGDDVVTVAGVRLIPVYDTAGNRIQPVLTGEDGSYCFNTLPAGKYYVLFQEYDNTLVPTQKNAGEDPSIDSDAEEAEDGAWIREINLPGVSEAADEAISMDHLDLGLKKLTGTIRIMKKIDDAYAEFGRPTFLYRITGPDRTYYRQLTVNGEDGVITLTDLPLGSYTIEEIDTRRYSVREIQAVENGSISGQKAEAKLTAENNAAEFLFLNDLDDYGRYSHNDIKVNSLRSNRPVSLKVSYTGPSRIVSESESSYAFKDTDLSGIVTYDDGTTRPVGFLELTLSPAEVTNKMNTSGAAYPVRCYYTERGITLSDAFSVEVELKQERTFKISYWPNGGRFEDGKTRNPVLYRFDEDQEKAVITSGTYERPRHNTLHFSGWSTKSDGSGAYYEMDEAADRLGKETEENITLYAQWRAQVTLDANGGTVNGKARESLLMETGKEPGTGLTASHDDASYTFLGWNTSKDGKGTWIGDYGILKSDVTFYAVWEVYYYQIYGYTGSVQTFTAPADGNYLLQTWGAQGGAGGKGGYSEGTVELKRGDILYVYVGGQGEGGKGGSGGAGGYNGGAKGGNGGTTQHISTTNVPTMTTSFGGAAGGGGATHIATTERGELYAYNSYRDEVLIVAGGGSGSVGNTGGGGSFGRGNAGRGTPAFYYDAYGGGQQWGPDAGGAGGYAGGRYGTGGTGNIDNVENGQILTGAEEMPVCRDGKKVVMQTGQSGNGAAKISLVTDEE